MERQHKGTIHPKYRHSVTVSSVRRLHCAFCRMAHHTRSSTAPDTLYLLHLQRLVMCQSQAQAAVCCQPSQPHALQEAESDAAASQVQVASMQRQLTAARCKSLLELRQQVLGGTSDPDMSSEEFSFRPSGAANEVCLLPSQKNALQSFNERGS